MTGNYLSGIIVGINASRKYEGNTMEQLIEKNTTPVMTPNEYAEHILYVSKLETTIASLLMARERDEKVINTLVRRNQELEEQHENDTRMWVNNPLNATKEYKA